MKTGQAPHPGKGWWRIATVLIWAWAAGCARADMWVWLDDNGRRVLSDRPPPASVPPQHILQRPAPAVTPPADTPTRPAPTTPAEIRADNCQRAQASLAVLKGPHTLLMPDEQGRPVPMDEAMKRAERARLRQIIRDNCR